MDKKTVVFDSQTGGGNRISGYIYKSSCPDIKGVIQICHGMAEYIGRYEQMIEFLNNEGWHVVGIDMLGHGETYELNKDKDMPKGFFGEDKNAPFDILGDVMKMHDIAKEEFGEDIPYLLYGHSMGSFVARSIYSTPEYSKEFKAFTFSSTMGPNPLINVALFLSMVACIWRSKKEAKFLNFLAFGAYNQKVKNPKTAFDWISSDEAEVKTYVEDPMLGFIFTNKGMQDLFKIVQYIQSDEANALYAHKPVFFAYGEHDPVGSYGKGVEAVANKIRKKNIEVKIKNYGPYRHEIQREEVRFEYFKDVSDFFAEEAKKA